MSKRPAWAWRTKGRFLEVGPRRDPKTSSVKYSHQTKVTEILRRSWLELKGENVILAIWRLFRLCWSRLSSFFVAGGVGTSPNCTLPPHDETLSHIYSIWSPELSHKTAVTLWVAIRGVDILYLGKRDRRKAGWRSTRNFDPVVQSSLQAQHQNVKLETSNAGAQKT